MKILIVDDEQNICMVLREYAKLEGFDVDVAFDGSEAIRKCEETVYDIVIMDIMMPIMDGFEATKIIKRKYEVPIILLSAKNAEHDKLEGFGCGADDYVTKPFSPKEMMARVNVILKRHQKKNLKFGGLEVDLSGRRVTLDGKELILTPKEYGLLVMLLKNNGIAISREQIIKDVWGYDFIGDERTIDTHVKSIRNAIGRYKACIVTQRGFGYKFEYEEIK